jgi:hypothetical protein
VRDLVEHGILLQHLTMQELQVASWLDAELLGEKTARFVERPERLGLAAGVVERAHLQGPQALTQGIARDQGPECCQGSRSVPDEQHRLDPILLGRSAQLVEASDLCGGEWLEGEIGVRRAAPETERGVERAPGSGRVTADEGEMGLGGESFEAVGIDAVRDDAQGVTRRLGDDHRGGRPRHAPRLQDPAEVRDVRLQRRRGGARRSRTPQLVDETVDRHDLVQHHEQHGEDRALAWRSEIDPSSVRVDDLQGPEDPEVHRPRSDPSGPSEILVHPYQVA